MDGMNTDKNKNNRNRDNKPAKSAAESAYAYLANRMRTVSETEKHLSDKGYSRAEITDAVNELIGLRYLDDYLYALRYYEYNREKKRGTLRAERELAEKGVDQETIRNAKEDFLYENKVDEFEDALSIARREVLIDNDGTFIGEDGLKDGSGRGRSKAADDKLAAKIARRLESKGFASADIWRVLDVLRREGQ